jgi:PIN domain nuclease of toxin-antitoxin system
MVTEHRIETTVPPDGVLRLSGLPFLPGQRVEIVIQARPAAASYPLRGTPVQYDRPFEPVDQGDWDAYIQANEANGLGVSAISCWEVAKLVERGRLTLPVPVGPWMQQALGYPGVRLIPLSPEVAVESTQLPGAFHRDPADQIIVATARILNCPLVTLDQLIRAYPHVQLAP